jgi:CHAD domain-containing protein
MSLPISDDSTLQEGINKAIREENLYILEVISDTQKDSHEKIHEIRKSLKKLRAVVRLVRKCTDRYQEENIFYRDLGREISYLRDKTALLESLVALQDHFSEYLYKRTFNTFQQHLIQERTHSISRAVKEQDPFALIENQISMHLGEFQDFQIQDFEQVTPGLRKVYKRGKKALETARDTPTSENFHEWRKRTKYLRYQLEMLMKAWPHLLTMYEESLHDLSDQLGLDHDLSLLQDKAHNFKDLAFKSEQEYELLTALIMQQRQLLQEKAIHSGQKLYLDEPDIFADKMHRLWKIESK